MAARQLDAGGKIQQRLNSDVGLILCRTKATPDSIEAVYVTKDLSCLLADFTGPQKDRLTRELTRFAKNLVMAVDRLPEHANRFKKEMTTGRRRRSTSASASSTRRSRRQRPTPRTPRTRATTSSTNGKGAAQAAPTLVELRERIQAEDTAMKKLDKTTLERALRIGGFLRQAGTHFPTRGGGWYEWLKATLPDRHPSTAALWIQLADPTNLVHTRGCLFIEEAIRAIRGPRKPRDGTKPKTTTAGRRLRGLYKQRRDHDTELLQARIDVFKLVQVLEVTDLPAMGVGDADDDTLTEILEELTIASTWVDGSLAVVAAHLGEQEIREQVRKLREDTNGRTPHEITTAAKIADRLEQKLRQPALGT